MSSPKIAAASIFVPRRCPNCFLSLQEALQDQQGGLTQASFKVLPLCKDSEHVRFLCAPFKSRVLFSYSPLALPYASPAGLQSLAFRGLITPVQDPQAGEPNAGLRPLTPWGEPLQLWLFSCLWIACPRGMNLDSTVSPLLLPISLWFLLCIFSCGKSFLLVFRSFSSIVAL